MSFPVFLHLMDQWNQNLAPYAPDTHDASQKNRSKVNVRKTNDKVPSSARNTNQKLHHKRHDMALLENDPRNVAFGAELAKRRNDDDEDDTLKLPSAPPPPHITLHILSHCPRILPVTLSQYQFDTLLVFFSGIILREGVQRSGRGDVEETSQSSSPYLVNLALAMLIAYLEQSEPLRKRFHKFRKSEIPWYRFAIEMRIREALREENHVAEIWVRQLVRLREMMGLERDVLEEERELVKVMDGVGSLQSSIDNRPESPEDASENPHRPNHFAADEEESREFMNEYNNVHQPPRRNSQHKNNFNIDWSYISDALVEWFEEESRQGRDAPLHEDRELYLQALKEVRGEKALKEQLKLEKKDEDDGTQTPETANPRDSTYMDDFLSPVNEHPYDDDFSSNPDLSDASDDEHYAQRRDSAALDQPPTLKPRKKKFKSTEKKKRKKNVSSLFSVKKAKPKKTSTGPTPYVSHYGNIIMDSLAVWIEDDPRSGPDMTLEQRLEQIRAASFSKPLPPAHRKRRSRRQHIAISPVLLDFTVYSTFPPNQLMQSKLNDNPQVYELVIQLRCTELPSVCELMLTPVPTLHHYKPQITRHVHVPQDLHFEVHQQANHLSHLFSTTSNQLRAKFCDTLWDAMRYEEVIRVPFRLRDRGMRIQLRASDVNQGQARACAVRDVWIVERKQSSKRVKE